MSSPLHSFATSLPMRPRPITPTVRPATIMLRLRCQRWLCWLMT